MNELDIGLRLIGINEILGIVEWDGLLTFFRGWWYIYIIRIRRSA
jgi:hypothetical protein